MPCVFGATLGLRRTRIGEACAGKAVPGRAPGFGMLAPPCGRGALCCSALGSRRTTRCTPFGRCAQTLSANSVDEAREYTCRPQRLRCSAAHTHPGAQPGTALQPPAVARQLVVRPHEPLHHYRRDRNWRAKHMGNLAERGYRAVGRHIVTLSCLQTAETWPNHSVEARLNIKTPGPRSGLVRCPPRGPGVLLSIPPHLKR